VWASPFVATANHSHVWLFNLRTSKLVFKLPIPVEWNGRNTTMALTILAETPQSSKGTLLPRLDNNVLIALLAVIVVGCEQFPGRRRHAVFTSAGSSDATRAVLYISLTTFARHLVVFRARSQEQFVLARRPS
jgi:hypothetical protein